MKPRTKKEARAIQTLRNRISILKARLSGITEGYSNYHELRQELADYEKLLEMILE